MTEQEKELKRIVDLLESHLGDSDGYLPDDITQEELEEEFPVEAAMQIAVKLMIDARATATEIMTECKVSIHCPVCHGRGNFELLNNAKCQHCRGSGRNPAFYLNLPETPDIVGAGCAAPTRTQGADDALPVAIYQVSWASTWMDVSEAEYLQHSPLGANKRIVYATRDTATRAQAPDSAA